jgi:hypothetical protein
LQGLPNFTHIGTFGFKIRHLAPPVFDVKKEFAPKHSNPSERVVRQIFRLATSWTYQEGMCVQKTQKITVEKKRREK